jgi:hypothetical protein
MYGCQGNDNHQLVIPEVLVQDIIRANHSQFFVTHPVHRTHSLIALNYWCPGMRKSIEQFARKCDLCQRRKSPREQTAPLGEIEDLNFLSKLPIWI